MKYARRRGQYEVLLDPDEVKERTVQRYLMGQSVWYGVGLVATVVLLAFACFPNDLLLPSHTSSSHDHHTIPTLLSVVHPETGDYLWALKNPLYERLQQASIVPYDNAISDGEPIVFVDLPRLRLDKTQIKVRDSLTLSWTLGHDGLGKTLLKENDVIALYCGSQRLTIAATATNLKSKRFVDAATVAQARATSQKHDLRITTASLHQQPNQQQQWHFPSFPVQRFEVCEFALLQAQVAEKKHKRHKSSSHHDDRPVYTLLGTSEPLEMESARTIPTAIHLALGDNPSEMVVQFVGGNKDIHDIPSDNEEGKPVAQFSKQQGGKDKEIQKASGTSHTYTVEDMCESPANITEVGKFQPPGMIHVVRLTDLEPNTVYEYKVGLTHGQGITWSDSFVFTSAPPVGDAAPYSYLVYGDQGCPANGWGQGGQWVADMTTREVLNPKDKNLPIRAIHHFGDLAYARGAGHIWDEWFNMISPFAPKVPLMVAVGNHEYDHTSGGGQGKDPSGVLAEDGYRPMWGNFHNDSGGECGVPTANFFTMPNGTNSNKVFWYSYAFGSVHTTVISTEHDLGPGSVQHEWILADLQSVDRQKTPWLVVEGHRPMYESQMNWADNAVGIARRYQLDDVLRAYKVDLVLSGHYHSYLRTCDGLYNSQCNSPGSPMHITIGSAGAALTEVDTFSNNWTDKLIVKFGYGRITVANASAMLFEFVHAGAANDTEAGEVQDHVWIQRER